MSEQVSKREARWTEKQLDKDQLIDEKQLEFVLWVEQYYMLHSELPDYDTTHEHIGTSEKAWREYWLYAPVREALLTRGIPLRLPDGADIVQRGGGNASVQYAPILTGRQLSIINELLDPLDMRPDHKKVSDAEITKAEFQAWEQDPVFRAYYDKRVEKLFNASAREADRALMDNVKSGDQTAIKYFNEMTGRYRPQDPQIVNFQLMTNQLIDILAGELSPSQLEKLQAKIFQVLASAGITPLQRNPAPVVEPPRGAIQTGY